MKSSQDFVASFHNLEGNTIGEKRKSLFHLLNKFQTNETIPITPKNHLESLFKIEALIHFRRTNELLEVLKNESEEHSKKIFKQPWFFDEAFKNYTAHEIVHKILPYTSFVVRNRTIRSLAKYNKDELKLDQVFDELLKRYGINTAKLLLPGCSLLKIEKVFKNCEVKLDAPILLGILKRSPYLLETYYEESQKSGCLHSSDLGKVEIYLANNETDIYFELIKKYNFFEQLGKRTTKKLINHNRKVVVLKADTFSKILHLPTLIKYLGSKDNEFLINCFPPNINEFKIYNFKTILDCYPKNKRFALFCETFQQKYKKTLWDEPEIVDDYLIENIVNKQERDKWIEYKISTGSSELDYIKYWEINSGVAKIKEKINLTKSVNARLELLQKLVDVCKCHNDMRVLTEVVKYVCKRHRNDDCNVRNSFSRYVVTNFKVKELNDEIWNSINELLILQKMNDEASYDRKTILQKYIEYLFIYKNQIKEDIFLELLSDPYFTLECFKDNPQLEKAAILFLGTLSENSNEDWNDQRSKAILFMTFVTSWNKRHPKDVIAFCTYTKSLESIKRYIKKNVELDEYDYVTYSLFTSIICTKNTNSFTEEIKLIYCEKGTKRYVESDIVFWLLKYDPLFVSKYFESLIKNLLDHYSFNFFLWNYIKKYAHFEFQNKTIQYCLEMFNNSHDSGIYLKVMAFVMRPEDFVNVVSKYIPTEEKMDIQDEEARDQYKIECSISHSLKYTKSGIVLPTLLQFCKGDYLGSALESLYYLFYHTPENKLVIFVNELAKRAVSVRKHALFLICQVGTIESIFQLLKVSSEMEKNVSVKKHLLSTTLNFFKKNPSPEFFELLKVCIPQLHVDDEETLNSITRLSNVPRKYKTEYFLFVINFLKTVIDKSSEIRKIFMNFLSNVNENIMENLDVNTCNSFVEEYFMNDSYDKQAINTFVSCYIFHANYAIDNKYQKIFSILKKSKYINRDFSCENLKKQKESMQTISQFLSHLTSGFERNNIIFVQKFYEYWLKYFTPAELFNEYLTLRIIIVEKTASNINEFAKLLIQLFVELNTTFGNYFIGKFSEIVKQCSQKFITYAKPQVEILCNLSHELLLLNQSVPICMLVLKLLPNDYDQCTIYYDVLKILHKINDVTVQSSLNMFINNM